MNYVGDITISASVCLCNAAPQPQHILFHLFFLSFKAVLMAPTEVYSIVYIHHVVIVPPQSLVLSLSDTDCTSLALTNYTMMCIVP